MTDIVHPHDRFLRTLLSNPETAGTFLREQLPKEVAVLLSPEPPELVDGSFVDEELRAHLTDRLYKVKTVTGRTALLYILIEHKSFPDRRIGWQLIKYIVEALKQWEREHPEWASLPAIVPLVFYHGEAQWRVPDEFLALVDAEEDWRPYLLNFRYTVMDLGHIPDQALSRQPRLRAWLLTAKYATRDDQQSAAKEVLVEALIEVPVEDFQFLMRYMVETFKSYDEQVLREIIRRVHPNEENTMMSQFAQEMMAKGEIRGEARGEARGRQEGEARGEQKRAASMLFHLLQRKFGSQPDRIRAMVESADLATLETWTDRILDANTPNEVFASPIPGPEKNATH